MTDERRAALRDATVMWLLAVRWEYLATGANPLKHWTQIQDRLLASARRAVDVATLTTLVSRGLGLAAPSVERAESAVYLAELVGVESCAWLDLIESEHGHLMALARVRAEARSALRKERTERAKKPAAPRPPDPDGLPFGK